MLVEGDAQVRHEARRLSLDDVRSRLQLRVPEGTDLQVGTTSGRVEIRGRAGHVAVTTESGRVEVDHAESVDVRTASGRVEVTYASGEVRIRSTNGRVEVRRCGPADVTTESGRIRLAEAHGAVRAHCVTGRIAITMTGAEDVQADTVSGRVEVTLPSGCRPFRPDGADAPSEPPEGYDCTVVARSVSGRVSVAPG